MKYVLDTCVLSDYVRRVGRVAEKMHAQPPHDLALTVITEHEMLYGLALRPVPKLAQQVRRLLSTLAVLPFDRAAAATSADLRADLARAGKPIGDFDALIAGVALAHKLTLVTSNTKEFERVRGLELINWR